MTAGQAFIAGHDLSSERSEIATCIGVCPQHDLLWDKLTGRDHLEFYGCLKGLEDALLTAAIDEGLRMVNLFHVGDKRVSSYSGGMKRRLSVAMSLIGNPEVVFMDEPSTGMDPASRRALWSAIQHAKKDKVIVLTTHYMVSIS